VDGARIERVLRELGYDPEAPALRLLRIWERTVGAELARECEPTDWRGKTLELTVSSPVWAQQVSLQKAVILSALREALGDAAPTELRTRVR
jgi:predicted nucleic acid-binding Zn ribbon protein